MTAVILELPRREERAPQDAPRPSALEWLRGEFAAECDRYVLWLPVFLGIGIGLYFLLPSEPPAIVPIILGPIVVASAWLVPSNVRALVIAALIALWIGFLAGVVRTNLVAAPVLTRATYADITGTVRWREPLESGALRLVIDVRSIGGLSKRETPKRVRVSLRGVDEAPAIGDLIELSAKLMPPAGPPMPGGYDYARVAWFSGVGAVGYGGDTVTILKPAQNAGSDISRWFASLRVVIEDRIDKNMPPRDAAIATALLVGARGGLSQDDTKAMQNAGVSHVLSISGFHFALIAGMIFFLVRGSLALIEPIALRWPLKKIAAVAAFGGSAFYVGLSDGSSPVIRSFIMFAVAILAILMDRPALSMRTVAFAAALILLVSPESLLDPSFEMSFGAVIGLLAAYEWWGSREKKDSDFRLPFLVRGIVATALTSLVAEMSTAPFAAYHFNQFQGYGLVGNEIVVPLLSFFIMPLGALGVVAMPFHLEHWPLHLMGWGIEQMLKAAHWTAGLPGAVAYLTHWPAFALMLMVAGGLWLALWRRSWRLGGVPLVLVGLIFALAAPGPDVFVAESGGAMAFRVHDTKGWSYGLLGVKPTSYRGEAWLKGLGVDPATPLNAVPLVKCDAVGCVVPAGRGAAVSLVRDGRALAEECASALALVSLVRIEGDCSAPRVLLDPSRLKAGAAALRFDDTEPRVEFAIEAKRPWHHGTLPDAAPDDD
ncbi:MAG: ComEC/Rec2 family competence protein [Alphaproteobacteria bacterium]